MGRVEPPFVETKEQFASFWLSALARNCGDAFLSCRHDHRASFDTTIERLSAEIEGRMEPFRDLVDLLVTIPGVGVLTAQVIIAETGGDRSRFPTAEHLASWAGMCPGNNESAGKHSSGKTRKGSKWLRGALTESAHAASQTKHTSLPPSSGG